MSWIVTFDNVVWGTSRVSEAKALEDAAGNVDRFSDAADPEMRYGDPDALRHVALFPTSHLPMGWKLYPATGRLLDKVYAVGGELSWEVVDGTADLPGGAA